MNRRTVLTSTGSALALIAIGPGRRLALAQATPEAADPFAAFPQLRVEIDDKTIPAIPDAQAGPLALTIVNTGTTELHFACIRLPDDVSNDQALSDLSDPNASPAWFDLNTIPGLGNPEAPLPGAIAHGLVEPTAGRWLLFDPIGGRTPAFWTILAGGSPTAAIPFPTAEVEVGLLEMDFTGLDEPVPAGSHVWQIANIGATGHEFILVPLPAGTTKDQLVGMVQTAEQGGDMSWYQPVGGQGITSPGRSSLQLLDLPAGTYGAMCLTPDSTGASHADMGMAKIITAV